MIQKTSMTMSEEEIQAVKDLDWEGYYSDCDVTMCTCGAILVAGMKKCWKCEKEV